jgi:hypothetical protein
MQVSIHTRLSDHVFVSPDLPPSILRSVQLLRWPDAIALQLCEKGAVRDVALASLHIGVPGLAGSPHVDPRPQPYQFTSLVPQRARRAPGACSPPNSPRCAIEHVPGSDWIGGDHAYKHFRPGVRLSIFEVSF